METGPRLKVTSDRLMKPGIEPVIPGLQGKPFIHYTTAAPELPVKNSVKLEMMFMKHYAPNPLLVRKDGNLL